MENECEALPGVAYPGVRDIRSTINTKTGYDDDDVGGSMNDVCYNLCAGKCLMSDQQVWNSSRFLIKLPEHTWGFWDEPDLLHWSNAEFHPRRDGMTSSVQIVLDLLQCCITTTSSCRCMLLPLADYALQHSTNANFWQSLPQHVVLTLIHADCSYIRENGGVLGLDHV